MSTSRGYHEYIEGCAIHRRDTMSTSGAFSTSEGYHSTSGVFSTLEGYHEYIGGYHEYIGGYHEYIGGCSVHRGDIMIDVGGYHEYIRGDIMSTSGDVQYIRVFNRN